MSLQTLWRLLLCLFLVLWLIVLQGRDVKDYTKAPFARQTFHASKKKAWKTLFDMQKPNMPCKLLPVGRIDTLSVFVIESTIALAFCRDEEHFVWYVSKQHSLRSGVEHLRSVCITSLNSLWIALYKQIRISWLQLPQSLMFLEMTKKESFTAFPLHVTAFTQLTDSFLSSSILCSKLSFGFWQDKPSLFEANDCKSC